MTAQQINLDLSAAMTWPLARLSAWAGLPFGWDRTHPAYVRYGLGPVVNVPRYTIYSLRAMERWG